MARSSSSRSRCFSRNFGFLAYGPTVVRLGTGTGDVFGAVFVGDAAIFLTVGSALRGVGVDFLTVVAAFFGAAFLVVGTGFFPAGESFFGTDFLRVGAEIGR